MKEIKAIKNIRESFKTRQVKYGGYAALITLAVIIGLILVNLLVGQFSLQVDMTSTSIFSLSEQTVQMLETIKTPVKFYGLWRPGEKFALPNNRDLVEDATTVINLYLSKHSNMTLELIDPDRNPGFVARYDKDKTGISRGSLIVEGEKGFRVIRPYDMYNISQSQAGVEINGVTLERRITSALLFAGTGTTPVVYEVTGHGEIAISALGLQDLVERENYSLRSLNLLTSAIPSDASAIIMINPQRDLNQAEADKLLDYLEKGGRFLIMADYNIGDLSNMNRVLASYGIAFEFGIVIEAENSYMINLPFTEIPDMADHDITKPLANKSNTPVLLQGAMALRELGTKRRTVEVKPLMTSSPRSFLRTDLNEASPSRIASDISGPLILGMTAMDPSWVDPNNPVPQARIVAIGCGSLLPIAVQLGVDANRDLFMNSFSWLGDRPENITIRAKSLYILPMRLTLVQIIVFGVLFIFVIPVGLFTGGFVNWLKRRHL